MTTKEKEAEEAKQLAADVATGKLLRRRIKLLEAATAKWKAELTPVEERTAARALAVATATKTGGKKGILDGVEVSFPADSIKLTPENWVEAKRIAGAQWSAIAERVAVPFALVKAARDVMKVVFTPAKAARLFRVLASENSPRFKYL